ncbi:MAG: peroxiredoxin, partial [Pseudomonadota bacterium]
MTNLNDVDWSQIPAPQDDGAAAHLVGVKIASVVLPATDATAVNLASLAGTTVLYIYPMTGRPDVTLPDGWDDIPGARGCTPQSCSFRDHYMELTARGVDHLYGLSTQTSSYQAEAVERLHLPFALLSDDQLDFAKAMNLPTFKTDGMTLLKRLTMIISDGTVIKTFYPVFPPDQNAADVIA